jgi:M6 family metalloprotease-like protein
MKPSQNPKLGYRQYAPEKGAQRVGWCEPHKPNPSQDLPPELQDVPSSCLEILAGDSILAAAQKNTVRFYRTEGLVETPSGKGGKQIQPIATHKFNNTVACMSRGRVGGLIVSLTDGKVIRLHLDPKTGGITRESELADLPGFQAKAVIVTASRTLLRGHNSKTGKNELIDLSPLGSGRPRRIPLPTATVKSVRPIIAAGVDSLMIKGLSKEVNLLTIPTGLDGDQPIITPLAVNRVNAFAILDKEYGVVARKGGYLEKVALAEAVPQTASPNQDKLLARYCKLFSWLVENCGCATKCDCDGHNDDNPGEPGRPDPDRSGRGIDDDRPCDEKQRAKLNWSATELFVKKNYVVALAAGSRRMAVLDKNLNLVFERFLGNHNTTVLKGDSTTNELLLYTPKKHRIEAFRLDLYDRLIPGLPADQGLSANPLPPHPVDPAVYYGRRTEAAGANPHLRVAVFTITEPGQAFNDPNQTNLVNGLTSNVFETVNDYYEECSFGELQAELPVFGHDFGGTRQPLVLPEAFANYFYDDFTPGGIETVMPGDMMNPLRFDGTETLELQTDPRVGAAKAYTLPFAALWLRKVHATFPVTVEFDGTESAVWNLTDQEGNAHVLNLDFPVFSATLNQGGDEAAFLTSLADYLTTTVRAAENDLPGNPTLLEDVEIRRIRTDTSNDHFGRLQTRIAVRPVANPADFVEKGTVVIASMAGTTDGFTESGWSILSTVPGSMDSVGNVSSYFLEAINAGLRDQGDGVGLSTAQLSITPSVSFDGVADEFSIRINLTNSSGGSGAEISLTNATNLTGSGWESATEVTGSDSNVDNQNTMRYSGKLANDIFTAALAHLRATTALNRNQLQDLFADFDGMMIGFVGSAPGAEWDAANPNDKNRLRMFVRGNTATDQNPPAGEDPIQMSTSTLIGQRMWLFDPGVMAHELGHAIGLPDLYRKSGRRDDVGYIGSWGMMGGGNGNLSHFCGWSKWVKGWIAEDADPDVSQVIDVPMPEATGTSVTETWLFPVEYFDDSIMDDVRDQVGGSVPINQLMKVNIGSDGGVFDFVELKAPGTNFSQNLPGPPSIIITSVLDPDIDRRWAVNGLYRASVHPINDGTELRSIGDSWDFASGKEFPVKGTKIEIIDTQTIRGGTIPVFRVRIAREQAEFIDLYFQDNSPSWRSPDIWVDWPGDNVDPADHRVYPVGTPTSQGEAVRFPSEGVEPHFLVTRVHNGGNVMAENVKVRWFLCDPPGSGDDGRWVQQDTKTIPEIGPGDNATLPFTWNVNAATNDHQCIRTEIIDWTIPDAVDPDTGDTVQLASDDVKLQNNSAQQNVFDFEALTASPYEAYEFEFQVHNSYVKNEIAVLLPEALPYGSKLTVIPAEAVIEPGKSFIFKCVLELDDSIITPDCKNDQGFKLTAWRRADEADENWGSCFYFVRPRYKTKVIQKRLYFKGEGVVLWGELKLLAQDGPKFSELPQLSIRSRFVFTDPKGTERVVWRNGQVNSAGFFTIDATNLDLGIIRKATAQTWFDRTDRLGSSVSDITVWEQAVIF